MPTLVSSIIPMASRISVHPGLHHGDHGGHGEEVTKNQVSMTTLSDTFATLPAMLACSTAPSCPLAGLAMTSPICTPSPTLIVGWAGAPACCLSGSTTRFGA